MKKFFSLAAVALILNSCCYCVVNVPELYPIPEEWELVEVCDGDATEVIPCGK